MLGTLRNFIDRVGPVRSRQRTGIRPRTPAPVFVAVADQTLADDVALIIAVIGRERVTDRVPENAREVIVIRDAGDATDVGPSGRVPALITDLTADGVAVRTVRVGADTAPDPGDADFLLPAQSTDLAAHLGAVDRPDCAVIGAVGGAGTSTFAVALAGALADPALGGDGRALLVDGSGRGDLDHLLALEEEPGRRLVELAGTLGGTGLSAPMLRDLPWAGDVAVLTGAGTVPEKLTVDSPVVRDLGRWTPSMTAATVASSTVLVIPATVPGTLAGRDILTRIPGALVVLRETPRAALEWNDALTILGRVPEVTWADDPHLTAETDHGHLVPDLHSTGTAGTAAARLIDGRW